MLSFVCQLRTGQKSSPMILFIFRLIYQRMYFHFLDIGLFYHVIRRNKVQPTSNLEVRHESSFYTNTTFPL